MPKLYEYLGIVIFFYSEDHKPIHIHANYDGNNMKVSFFIKDEKIYRITYQEINGKFSSSKLKHLKAFINAFKEDIVKTWIDFFVYNKDVKFERITKKL